jgi:hypothetical protein
MSSVIGAELLPVRFNDVTVAVPQCRANVYCLPELSSRRLCLLI